VASGAHTVNAAVSGSTPARHNTQSQHEAPAGAAGAAGTSYVATPSKRSNENMNLLLDPHPFRIFAGHAGDIVDIAWSASAGHSDTECQLHISSNICPTRSLHSASSSHSENFILTASTDKTVRLWHVDKDACLQVFRHPDIVTAVQFHPQSDKKFVSACFDKRVRIWEIVPDPIIRQYCAVREIVSL
jgi:WD40 repeat protein